MIQRTVEELAALIAGRLSTGSAKQSWPSWKTFGPEFKVRAHAAYQAPRAIARAGGRCRHRLCPSIRQRGRLLYGRLRSLYRPSAQPVTHRRAIDRNVLSCAKKKMQQIAAIPRRSTLVKLSVARGERAVSGLRVSSRFFSFSSEHRRLTWRSALPTSIWIRAIDGHFATQR